MYSSRAASAQRLKKGFLSYNISFRLILKEIEYMLTRCSPNKYFIIMDVEPKCIIVSIVFSLSNSFCKKNGLEFCS